MNKYGKNVIKISMMKLLLLMIITLMTKLFNFPFSLANVPLQFPLQIQLLVYNRNMLPNTLLHKNLLKIATYIIYYPFFFILIYYIQIMLTMLSIHATMRVIDNLEHNHMQTDLKTIRFLQLLH